MAKKAKKDTYQVITDRIIEALEGGRIPWEKPWTGGHAPANMVSKKEYQGLNIVMLGCSPHASRWFLTFNQAKKINEKAFVKKGERGYPIVFWKFLDIKDKEDETKTKRVPFLRYSTVFNVEQFEGIEAPVDDKPVSEFTPIERAEKIWAGYKGRPELNHNVQRACYSPSQDVITMPKQNTFKNPESYYATLFHEMTHSTGHENRLNRTEIVNCSFFGDAVYSREELTAEFGASFLNGEAGIETPELDRNSASYIQGWLGALRGDKKMLVSASSKAKKAVQYILTGKKESVVDTAKKDVKAN